MKTFFILLKGTQEAGYQLTEWNASGYASGVYFYRLEAREDGGGKQMVEARKLMLVK